MELSRYSISSVSPGTPPHNGDVAILSHCRHINARAVRGWGSHASHAITIPVVYYTK